MPEKQAEQNNRQQPNKKNHPFKIALIIFCLVIALLVLKVVLILTAKPTITVDYVAELNRISKPDNYDPNKNAAPKYERAFKLFVIRPEKLSLEDVKIWPEDLTQEKQILLHDWISANTDALNQLKLGSQKSYYWLEYQGSSLWDVVLPDLAKARSLMYTLCSRAKLNATGGSFKAALFDLVVYYRFGMHFAESKSMVYQLVGISIITNALEAGFQILDNEKPDMDLLKDFQERLKTISPREAFVIDFTSDKLLVYDTIQRAFTDDGKGGGHIYGTRLLENKSYMKRLFGQHLTEEQKRNLKKLERRQTTELFDRHYEYFNGLVYKTPWQLRSEGKNIRKVIEVMTKDNPLLNMLTPPVGRVLEMSFRGKVETDALITTLALLCYRADQGQFPQNLEHLVAAGYLNELPMDPYSDGPLVYKRIDDDFTLYSFGTDFDDDGGTPSKWGEGEQGGDQVFWPVKKE